MNALIGRKLGMTRLFDAAGTHVPVTVIEAGQCPVVQVTATQVQLGFGAKKAKRTPKALGGHVRKAGLDVAPRVLRNFPLVGGGPEAHGNPRHRKPGSIAPGTDPSRVIKGKRMPGHMGARNVTELGLRVVRIDAERNLLFVRGSVPGPMNGLVTVRKQGGPSRHD